MDAVFLMKNRKDAQDDDCTQEETVTLSISSIWISKK
jgi:hypothetical protein